MMTRREALKTTAAMTVVCATASLTKLAFAEPISPETAAKTFTLPPLPYALDSLEPHIDARTMEIHHDKHHAAYIANLNAALSGASIAGKYSLAELLKNPSTLPESVRTAVRNNGGGHYNHSLFWKMMNKNGGGEPRGDIRKAIDTAFGGLDAFKRQFGKAAAEQFGSGWAWLTYDGSALKIESTPNQDTPYSQGRTPLLGLDVWEHAYYLKYQNRRADYVAGWWNVVNWEFVSESYSAAKKA